MKRFQFSLQSVHDLRQMRRDEAERELARAADDTARAADAVAEIKRLRSTAIDAYTDSLRSGTLCPDRARLHVDYLATLTRHQAQAEAHLAAAEKMREEKRQAAATAACEAEATIKLRARHQARYDAEAARLEQNSLDEMATLAVARNFVQKS